MQEIVFTVERDEDSGWFVAHWGNPKGGGITTQGKGLHHLEEMIRDAVSGYFESETMPHSVRLHFMEDPELVVA